jgi:O-antigen/teichoic acid export membrane protein
MTTRLQIHHPLRLHTNIVWALVGTVLGALGQWLILVLIAKLGSPNVVGQFGMCLAITAPPLMVANLDLRSVLATDAQKAFGFGDYFGLRIVCALIAVFMISIFATCTAQDSVMRLAIIFMGFAKASEALTDLFQAQLQQLERMDAVAASRFATGLLTPLCVLVALSQNGDIITITVVIAILWSLKFLLIDIPLALRFGRITVPRFDIPQLRRLASVALPLGIVTGMVSLQVNIPRYYLDELGDKSLVGIFTALSYFEVAGHLIVVTILYTLMPRFAREFANDNIIGFCQLLTKVVATVIGAGLVILSLVFVFGDSLLQLFYTVDYSGYASALLALFVAGTLRWIYEALQMAIRCMRCFKGIVAIQTISVVGMAATCSLLIPSHGLFGATLAMCIVHAAILALHVALFVYCIQESLPRHIASVVQRKSDDMERVDLRSEGIPKG